MIATVHLNFAVDIPPVFHVVPKGYDISSSSAVFELRDKNGAELYAESSDGITVETITLTATLKYADGTEIPDGTEVLALRVAPDLSALTLGDPAHINPMQYRFGLRVDGAWTMQGWLTVWPDTGPVGCMGSPLAICCGPVQVAVNVCGVVGDGGEAGDVVWGEVGGTIENQTDLNARLLQEQQKNNLTDAGDSTLHYHADDRDRANHTGQQSQTTITGLTSDLAERLQRKNYSVRNITAPTDTATVNDCYLNLSSSSNNVALTLPETDSLIMYIKHDHNSANDNTATITNTVNGQTGPWVLPKGPYVVLIHDGTEWVQAAVPSGT